MLSCSWNGDVSLLCGDLMKPNVFKVFEKRPVVECLGLMRSRDMDSVVVTNEAKEFVGVAKLDDLIEMRDKVKTVGEVADKTVPTFAIGDDAKDAVHEITTNKHDYVLVLDHKKTVSGIITRGSIARSLTEVIWGDLDA